MNKIITIALFIAVLGLPAAYSQTTSYAIQYDISSGSGDLSSFIGKTSFRGASFDIRHEISSNISLGVTSAWNVFYERKDYGTYNSGNNDLSGVQYRYQNQIPILVAGSYTFNPENTFKPYVDFGIGTLYTERTTDMGLYRLEENQWHFAIKPELGVVYEINPGVALKLAARYYNGFEAGDLDSQNYFSISTGFVFGN